MDPLSTLLIGTAAGTLLTTISSGFLARSKAKSDERLEQVKLAGQMRQAAQAALRTQLQEAHGKLLDSTQRFLDPGPEDEEPVFGWGGSDWEAEYGFRSRVETLRLLADATTVRAAELMIVALMEYLCLLDAAHKCMKADEWQEVERAVAPERRKVEEARRRYVHCAQVDLGLTAPDKAISNTVLSAENPYDDNDLRSSKGESWKVLAAERLAEARTAIAAKADPKQLGS